LRERANDRLAPFGCAHRDQICFVATRLQDDQRSRYAFSDDERSAARRSLGSR
jgi:hypothetical protein